MSSPWVLVDLCLGVIDGEHTRRFISGSLRGLDQGIPSDPSRHGRSWSLRNPEANRLTDDQSKPGENDESSLAGLGIGSAVPALAQDRNTVDPQVRQEIEATLTKFEEAFNKHEATAMAC